MFKRKKKKKHSQTYTLWYIIKDMRLKTRYTFALFKLATIKKFTHSDCYNGVKKRRSSYVAAEMSMVEATRENRENSMST